MIKKRITRVLALALSVVIILASLCSCDDFNLFDSPNSSKGKLVCHYRDVGQGDSIFIELPNSQTMLIDSGENYHGAGIISGNASTQRSYRLNGLYSQKF